MVQVLQKTYDEKFSYLNLKESVNQIRQEFTEEEILNFLLEQEKEDKVKYLMPIFYLSKDFLLENVQKVFFSLKKEEKLWIYNKISKLLSAEFEKEWFYLILSNFSEFKSYDDSYDDLSWFTGPSELNEFFKEHSSDFNLYKEELKFQEMYVELVKYLASKNLISDNSELFKFLFKYCANWELDMWQDLFVSLLVVEKKSWFREYVVDCLEPYKDKLNENGVQQIVNYFEELIEIKKEEIYILVKFIDVLFPTISKKGTLNKIEDLIVDLQIKNNNKLYYDLWAEWILKLPKNSVEYKQSIKMYCEIFWKAVKSGEDMECKFENRDMVNDCFVMWVNELNNSKMNDEIVHCLQENMKYLCETDDVLDKNRQKISPTILRPFRLEDVLVRLIDINAKTIEEKKEILIPFFLETKNKKVVLKIKDNILSLPNAEEILSKKLCSLEPSSYISQEFIKAYVEYLPAELLNESFKVHLKGYNRELRNLTEKIALSLI